MTNILFATMLGALTACGFAPLDWWPLTIAAVAGWLALVRRAPTLRAALARGWGFGLGQFAVGLNWIATAFTYQAAMPAWLGWVAVALLAIYLAIYPAAAAGLAWRWGREEPRRFVLLAAAAWIVTEWLRATLFTGFAWNPLGVIWVAVPPVAQAAAWTGSYALSGVVVLTAGALLLLAERAWRPALLLAAPALLAAIGGTILLGRPTAPGGAAVRIVQPNIEQQEKWRPELQRQNYARLAGLSGRPGAEPRLLLWPEAAVPDYLEEEPWARRGLARLLGPRDLLLTGGTALEYGGGEVIAARNSLFVMDARGVLRGRYDKAHLVPYGEYLPMRPILAAIGLSRLAPGDLDFWPGPGAATLPLPGFGSVGVQICYEIIFAGQVVQPGARPRFLFNPSNDAWFGAWGPPQHLAQARLRAIEEGLPILRATPTGISAVIDADGRLIAALPWRTAGAIDARIPAAEAATPFARAGNLLGLGWALLLVVLAVVRRRARR